MSAEPMPAEAAPAPRGEKWLDRVSPIVIKELRQGLRGKIFAISFGLMLLVCLLVAVTAAATSASFDGQAKEPVGAPYFAGFSVILALALCLVVPLNAFRATSAERAAETWSLLVLTGLGAPRIVLGKFGSQLVQAALYASAITPFVLFSYYLNGLELKTIGLTLLGIFSACLLFTSAAIAGAASTRTRGGRAAVQLIFLLGLGMFLLTGPWQFFLFGGIRGMRSGPGPTLVWLFSLWLSISWTALFLSAAAARLSLPIDDHAKAPRLAFAAQVLGTLLLGCYAWDRTGRESEAALGFGAMVFLQVVFSGPFLSTDWDGLAPRFRPPVAVPLLRPGARRGFLFVVAVTLLALGAVAGLISQSVDESGKTRALATALAAVGYFILYLSLAIILTRGGLSEKLASPAMTRGAFYLLAAVGSVIPPILAAVMATGRWERSAFLLLSPPFGSWVFFERYWGAAPMLALWTVAAGCALWAERILARRARALTVEAGA